MTDVVITVRGSHAVTSSPEQATVYAVVSADGPAPEPVFGLVAASLAELTESLPVTRYTVEQIRTGAHRPYNQDGHQLPLVHTASAAVTATFTDFEDLAAWIGRTAGLAGLAVNHIEWALTEQRRLTVERETRQEAVRDARRRAQDYA
ncbi:MAG: SIMPL domain-containing protein, partial [Mycobacterium sp.]|nr:SIMPL domain-containing protein [Mycobacterium sp.]